MAWDIPGAVKGITALAGKFITDKDAKVAFDHAVKMAAMDGSLQRDLQQISVNLQDSKSDHLIQYGWRPFIGWVCGAALAYSFILKPFIDWIAFMNGYDLAGMPDLDMTQLSVVLMSLLGLGVARTTEKIAKTKNGKS